MRLESVQLAVGGEIEAITKGNEAMCPPHLVVNRAAAMCVNVQKAICDNGCPLRLGCGFLEARTSLVSGPRNDQVRASSSASLGAAG